MITLFRIKTFFHVFSILGVLLLLKVPMILDSLPILQTEMEWMLIGERLSNGHSLYKDIWTEVSPLSAYVYGFIYTFFGRNQFYYELFAVLLIYFQALYFSYIINRNKVFMERNYLPALMYVLVMSLSFDANKLSPTLLSNTFLLLAINSLFKHIDRGDSSSENIFEVGLLIGVGTLFLYSFPVFIFWALLSLLMFSSFKANQILLLFVGFSLPLLLALLFFYFIGSLDFFVNQWLLQVVRIRPYFSVDTLQSFYVFIVPVAIAIGGVIKVISNVRYANFQSRKQQILILLGMFSFLAYFLSGQAATYLLLAMSPFLAFFIAGFFIHMRGIYLPEILFMGVALAIIVVNYQGLNPFLGKGYQHLADLRINKESKNELLRDKAILVTGPQMDDYYLAKSGSAYLNWNLSKDDLEHPDIYQKVASIQQRFSREKPELIIDNAHVFPAIFHRIPALQKEYEQIPETKNYRLK